MTYHVMIDIETMGKRFDAPVTAIGAVNFDPSTGEQYDEFYAAIDIESAFRFGKADGDTVRWWMRQKDAAREAAVCGTQSLPDALKQFSFWYGNSTPSAVVWGNGPTFDISILEYAYARTGIDVPWEFWNVRDCRTIKDVGSFLNVYTGVQKGVAHNALDDAKSQARWVSEIWQKLVAPHKATPPSAPTNEGDDF